MNRHVNAIAGRLSLRPPQHRSLEILDRLTEIVPPQKGADVAGALAAIRSEFPTVTDFERDFASLCFALATGVGKTRLMGAFISYLHLANGSSCGDVRANSTRRDRGEYDVGWVGGAVWLAHLTRITQVRKKA